MQLVTANCFQQKLHVLVILMGTKISNIIYNQGILN